MSKQNITQPDVRILSQQLVEDLDLYRGGELVHLAIRAAYELGQDVGKREALHAVALETHLIIKQRGDK